jgi:hypothetical protein
VPPSARGRRARAAAAGRRGPRCHCRRDTFCTGPHWVRWAASTGNSRIFSTAEYTALYFRQQSDRRIAAERQPKYFGQCQCMDAWEKYHHTLHGLWLRPRADLRARVGREKEVGSAPRGRKRLSTWTRAALSLRLIPF